MSLLNLNNLSMSFGGQSVFANVTSQINKGDHLGLVGPNGVGKTTLLRIIYGSLDPSDGHVARQKGVRIGYLAQHPDYPPGQTVFDEVYSGLGDLKKIEDELRQCEFDLQKAQENPDDDPERLYRLYADLTDRYELLGGASAESKIYSILDGLSIPERLWQAKMETLSGGERNLVGLARVLIGDHDLMLLDEPGNHLDFSGLDWLENFLIESQKAFIIVSHNRYLLDKVCRATWEMQRGKLTVYGGNYSFYRSEKLKKELAQESAYKRAQKEISRLQFNIQRLKSWASVYDNPALAKTAKIFEKRVENLEEVERPLGDGRAVRFRFLTVPPRGKIAIELKNYTVKFDDGFELLKDVTFLISQGEHIAFIGDNGTGKTTLLKDIVDKGSWENQALRTGKSVTVGYFAQLGEIINEKHTLIEEAMRLTGLLRGNAADLLHRFMFTRDDLEKSVSVLSGGERARLQLAVLVNSEADCLLLDEPTNHLDIPSREAVEDALEEYPGTLVMVSHDRYFLDKLADGVLHFVPPAVHTHEGNFSEFWEKAKDYFKVDVKGARHGVMRKSKLVDQASLPDSHKTVGQSFLSDSVAQTSLPEHDLSLPFPRTRESVPKDLNGRTTTSVADLPKNKRKRVKFDAKRFKELEAEIKRLEDVRPTVEAELEKLTTKGKTTRAEARQKRLSDIDKKLEALYEEWLIYGEKKKKW